MSFQAKHLRPAEVRAVYESRLRLIEERQLQAWIDRLVNPACETGPEHWSRLLETLEIDLAATMAIGDVPPDAT